VAAETAVLPPTTSSEDMTLDQVYAALVPKPPRGGVPAGVGMLVAGIALMYAVLAPLGDMSGVLKVPFFLVSAYLAIKGIDVTGKTLRGPRFETGLWLCSAWLVLLTLAAIFADFLPFTEHVDTVKSITEPGNARPDFFSRHPLGSNNFSLDLLAQSVYAARVSVGTALLAVAIAIVVGSVLGMMAGYFRSWVDVVFGIYVDSIMSVPALLLLIAVITVVGKPQEPFEAVWKMGLTLAIVAVPTMARLARANTLVYAQREFVLAAKAMGASRWRIMFREIMPNVALPVLSYSFIIIATLIVAEGSLSFLGIGLKQPNPTWGNMIAEGRVSNVLRKYPHIALVPGVFMFLTVYSFNMVGEKFRSLWDARDSKL
jgi:peptide/nickel transport system permease protein